MAERTSAALSRWSDDGRLPVVMDASSCALGLVDGGRRGGARLDRLGARSPAAAPGGAPEAGERRSPPVLWRAAHGPGRQARAPRGPARRRSPGAGGGDLLRLRGRPRAAASGAGAGGNRGRGAELREHPCEAHLSSNRTCEIGLEQATGAVFESFLFSLEQATRPAPTEALAEVFTVSSRGPDRRLDRAGDPGCALDPRDGGTR